MLELYLDERGEVALENFDDVMAAFPEYAERGIASAFKSEGYRLKNILQAAIRQGGRIPGEWPELNPHTGILGKISQKLSGHRSVVKNTRYGKRKESILSTRRAPLAKLAGAIRYHWSDEDATLTVGFTKAISGWKRKKMRQFLHLQAEGYATRITPRMRKFLFAVGFPVKKSTTRLVTPPRPLVEPVFKAEKERILANIPLKFANNIARYMSKGRMRKK